MKNLYASNRKSLAGLAVVILLSGCASMPDNLAANGKLKVDRVNSRDARIVHVYVRTNGSEMRVSGDLHKTPQKRGRIPGHLHIEVFGDNGALLIQTTGRYHRRNAKSRRSHFSETLPIQPGKATKVRVIHHGLYDNHG